MKALSSRRRRSYDSLHKYLKAIAGQHAEAIKVKGISEAKIAEANKEKEKDRI